MIVDIRGSLGRNSYVQHAACKERRCENVAVATHSGSYGSIVCRDSNILTTTEEVEDDGCVGCCVV